MDASINVCADCGMTPDDVNHLFNYPAHPMTLIPSDLWNRPMDAIRERSYFATGYSYMKVLKPHPVGTNISHIYIILYIIIMEYAIDTDTLVHTEHSAKGALAKEDEWNYYVKKMLIV